METDLSNILEPESNATSTTTEASIVFENNLNNASGENETNNATAGGIPTQSEEQNNNETTYKYTGQTADNTFTIYSTDENEIIKQIQENTNLDKMNKKYSYDEKSDSLFIHIKEGEEESFEEIVPGINIELNKDGEVIGVEILKASRFIKGLKPLEIKQ